MWNWNRQSNKHRKIYKNIREIRTDCGTGTEKVTDTGKFTKNKREIRRDCGTEKVTGKEQGKVTEKWKCNTIIFLIL